MALDFFAGCIGGCAGIIVGHPLDTLKVHVQSGRGSPLECAKVILKGGSAYRGVWAPLAGVAGVNAIIFGAYGNTRRAMQDQNSLITHASAGAVAGTLQSFACAPVELVKTRQQLSTHREGIPAGAWAGARHILRTEGCKVFFRGLSITIARDSSSFAVYFATYEALTRDNQSMMRVFTAGGLAGALCWILLYPVDVVKCRVQGDVIGRYAGSWDCFIQSVKSEGWRCMGRGLGAVTLRAFISNGACFSAVVWTERAWQYCTSSIEAKKMVQAAVISEVVRHDSPDSHYDT